MRKFLSNNKELQGIQPSKAFLHEGDDYDSYAKTPLGKANPLLGVEQKVLGILWDTDADEMIINLSPIFREAVAIDPTKRKLITVISIYISCYKIQNAFLRNMYV